MSSISPKSSRRGGYELLVYQHRERFSFALPAEGTVSLGRSAENDVRVEHRSVSRRHAQIHVSPERLDLEDLGSANGTYFVSERRDMTLVDDLSASRNDRQLTPFERTALGVGEMVRLGGVFLLVHRPNPTTLHDALKGTPSFGGTAIVVDPVVKRLHELGIRAAQSDITVLILGETGVGKEVLAELIHVHSPRASQPFLRLNCAALSETLLESELFGHEKGAFTGATTLKLGLLESTDGGTVFLDEIGELPLSTQVKLLRVLEDRAVRRVGGTRSRKIDVRFVTATNRDLRREVKRGKFREDLYFRVNGVKLELPPLRQRPSEIEPLARFFLHEFCTRSNIPEPRLSPAALERMLAYSWPGNVRELRNVMERAPFLVGEGYLQPEHIPREDQRSLMPPMADADEVEDKTDLHEVFPAAAPGERVTERDRVQRALDACGGNQTRAARMLGVSRRTLVNRLDEFNLPRPKKGLP